MQVVDASVTVKWFIPEEGAEEALEIFQDHISGRDEIFVPDLLFYEVVNALRYKNSLEPEGVMQFIETLSQIQPIRVGADDDFLKTVYHLAREIDVSVYDASYLILAERLQCVFVTADQKLAQKTGTRFTIRLIK